MKVESRDVEKERLVFRLLGKCQKVQQRLAALDQTFSFTYVTQKGERVSNDIDDEQTTKSEKLDGSSKALSPVVVF